MTGVSTKTVYAVAALYQLGSVSQDKLLRIKDIAGLSSVPQNFLEQILLTLRKNSILESVKGANGGYRLAKPLKDIYLKNLMEILENDAFVNPCKTGNETLKLFWDERSEDMIKAFDIPLSKLYDYEQKINSRLDYII